MTPKIVRELSSGIYHFQKEELRLQGHTHIIGKWNVHGKTGDS